MSELYVGLISGTSADGIDAVVVFLRGKTKVPRMRIKQERTKTLLMNQFVRQIVHSGSGELRKR